MNSNRGVYKRTENVLFGKATDDKSVLNALATRRTVI